MFSSMILSQKSKSFSCLKSFYPQSATRCRILLHRNSQAPLSCQAEQQPTSTPPNPHEPMYLRIQNTLTGQIESFAPFDSTSKKVTWFSWGPAINTPPHFGDARTYLTTDIIRRILCGYFGYDVYFVQSIADVNDKV
jgi:hypothetical protein